jgi:TM2 domain-containing membrane protein YozV
VENFAAQRYFLKERQMADNPESKRVICGVLAILFGYLGVHKFMLGMTTAGIIQIVISVCTLGLGGIIGWIEGIIYLTKSDEEFIQTYQIGKKQWF